MLIMGSRGQPFSTDMQHRDHVPKRLAPAPQDRRYRKLGPPESDPRASATRGERARLPVDNPALDWQGEGMRGNGTSTGMQWGLLIFGALFGLVCAVLILTEVLSPTLWFTVIAMGCLVLSQALLIRSKRRNR